jgi:putative intracellular protease/amidase
MKIAYIIFDGVTWLDFIGVYDAVSRLKSMGYMKDLSWDICSLSETARDNFGLTIVASKVSQPLDIYDAIIVPGGHGTRTLINDSKFLNWISTARDVEYKMSVCTGSLILGAAGFLKSKKATTNFLEYDALRPYCAEVLKQRLVVDGNVITAGAVSSSLDLGLYLCEKWAGVEACEVIRQRMDYHPIKPEQAKTHSGS